MNNHINNVKEFMNRANQVTADRLRIPSKEERIFRAKLIFEESMETINALGIKIGVIGLFDDFNYTFIDAGEASYNPKEVLDGITDIFVVATGAGICCGLTNIIEEALERVENNNLSKLDGLHTFREDGKLLKSPNYKPVELDDLIKRIS